MGDMTTSDGLPWEVVNEFGVLRSVAAIRAYSEYVTVYGYELAYTDGLLLVGVNSDDDTIVLGRERSLLEHRLDVSALDPWSEAIGAGLL
jgi:hypothetical protein